MKLCVTEPDVTKIGEMGKENRPQMGIFQLKEKFGH